MSRPLLELADLVRSTGIAFFWRSRQWIRWTHIKVLLAIARCRTAALGGHIDRCTRCGHRAISYNSCRNRHCPRCQTTARQRWIAARQRELLPTRYLHVVFTLPHELVPLALHNKKILYHLLLQTSAQTLLEVARDPKHLGAEIGFFSVLHTWNQKIELHPHVHCVVPSGGLSLDHTRWIGSRKNYFLPKPVLQKVFRGKFVTALPQAFLNRQLCFLGDLKHLARPKAFAAWLRPLHRQNWVVYLKRPFGGPEYVLQYLGRYTHRVAISNHRLVSFSDGQVTFRWRDSAHQNEQKLLTLSLDEFLRRFLLHILPKGFVRIRNFGFLANRNPVTLLPLCFQLLGPVAPLQTEADTSRVPPVSPLWLCPRCGGPMTVIERLTAAQLQLRSPPCLAGAAACNYHSKVPLTLHLTTGRRGAPNWPPNQPSVADLGSKSRAAAGQPQPNLPCLRFYQLQYLFPEAFPLNPTPLNPHNCPPTDGFLQTAVSDAPPFTPAHSRRSLWGRIRYSTNVYRELQWESEFASMSDFPCSRQRTTKIHLAEIGW